MKTTEDRRSWFGLGPKPRLPYYLRTDRGPRLKGLDEFEPPEFVGRMARVERRRELAWRAMLVGAVGVGATIGWVLF
jgi:hypothetical protein